ncbi:MAG: hypothetical protein E4G89_06175 [Methanothrix sp.]|nr:MAG: hypothetical protein E4G89_06175 [Methanothrix sp.]
MKRIRCIHYALIVAMSLLSFASAADFSKETVSDDSVKQALEDIINHEFTVSTNEISGPNEMNIIIKVAPWETWNTEMFVLGTTNTATEVFGLLFSNPTVERVYYWQNQIFIDAYGNEDISKAVAFDMRKETAMKINWDNFKDLVLVDYKNLFNVADDTYIHPAIKKDM